MTYRIIQGDNRLKLKDFPDNHFDSVVCDPPYGIDFLGKSWDANTGALETYQECLRVLKPGGHILAFSAARTYHHLAITLEQAGFEIRDQIMWIYSSGFPKSQDVGKSIERSENKRKDNALGIKRSKIESGPKTNCPKCNKTLNGENQYKCQEAQCDLRDALRPADNEWAGWGTALKPAHEPICLARKPTKQSIAQNVQRWGTGALNIDATRVPYLDIKDMESAGLNWNKTGYETGGPRFIGSGEENKKVDKPAEKKDNINEQGRFPSNVIGEIAEPYQKYFYCPKVSRAERHMGHEMPPAMFGDVQSCYDPETGERFAVGLNARGIATEASMLADMSGYYIDNNGNKTNNTSKNIWLPQTGNIYVHGLKEEYRKWCEANNKTANVGNNHPTVKPVELMKYLIKLVTPKNGTVLDPFCGSGSTGMAAVELGYAFVGIELDANYCQIASKRIAAWNEKGAVFRELFE